MTPSKPSEACKDSAVGADRDRFLWYVIGAGDLVQDPEFAAAASGVVEGDGHIAGGLLDVEVEQVAVGAMKAGRIRDFNRLAGSRTCPVSRRQKQTQLTFSDEPSPENWRTF